MVGLDLAELDPVTVYLHLVVKTAEEVHGAVGAEPRAVAGAVHPRRRPGAYGSVTKRSAVSSGRSW